MKRPTPWGPIMSIGAALLYGVSPIDLIPDLLPILGLLDDALVVPIVLLWAVVSIMHRNKQQAAPTPAPVYIDVPSTPVIPEDYERARH